MDFVTPSGFRDVLAEEAVQRERIQRAVSDCFAGYGYLPVETPTLEVMDVMRAGGRVPGTPFKFFDSKGDLLAMRPDVTLQLARMYATRLGDQPSQLKLRYVQRVFRESQSEADARELTQIGVENIGVSGVSADAEIVTLLVEALGLAGVSDFKLAIATVSILRQLLDQAAASAPAWWKQRVLDAFHTSDFIELDRLTCADGLVKVAVEAGINLEGRRAVGAVDEAAMLQRAAEIIPADVASVLRALPRVRGGREAIDQARALVAPLGCEGGLDDFAAVYDLLVQAGLESRLMVDFSVMSSFDYYTGLVFEAYSPYLGTPLGSGGRYDSLLGNYGVDRPAAGFAFYLEKAMAACQGQQTPASERPLRIAVPKGSLAKGTLQSLERAGLDVTGLDNPGRQLIIHNPGVDYIIVRPTDAPVFVETGAADCGICGRDSLLEADLDVVELVDLKFGGCRFVVAEPAGASESVAEIERRLGHIRIASKYPRITAAHYAKTGSQVEIVKLHGNIELAPLTGMAERIVDITATGTTLRENNLVIVEDVLSSTARFFGNVCSYRTDPRVEKLATALQKQAEDFEEE